MRLINRANRMSSWELVLMVFAMLMNVAAMLVLLAFVDMPWIPPVAWFVLILSGALVIFYITMLIRRRRGRGRATDEH